MPAVLHS